MKNDSQLPRPAAGFERRRFLKGSAAAAAAATFPGGAFAAGTDAIRVGLLGCGGRGTGAALQALAADPGVEIAAVGDRFPDQAEAAWAALAAAGGDRCRRAARFVGARAGDLVAEADVDAVILATPPRFRPAEISAAVRSGRHVYAEPPIGVDDEGFGLAVAAVDEGRRRGVSLASGLQSRHHGPTMAAVAAIAAGSIGRPRGGIAIHRLGLAWRRDAAGRTAEEAALRNWIHEERFSGGPLLWHHVHAIDRAHWALGEPTPLAAVRLPRPTGGVGPRSRELDPPVRIWFAGGATIDVGVGRREGIEDSLEEVVRGDRGEVDLRRCQSGGGHAACMASFIRSLRDLPPRDDLAAACRSTMLAALARAASAAGGRTVAWREVSAAPRPVQSSWT